jgi:hypothetical protein
MVTTVVTMQSHWADDPLEMQGTCTNPLNLVYSDDKVHADKKNKS